MKKKILSLCLVVALAATAVVGGTLAYFTDNDDASNTFELGGVDITLTEKAYVDGAWTNIESPDGTATLGQLDPGVVNYYNKCVFTFNNEDDAYIRNYVAIENIGNPEGYDNDIYKIWHDNQGHTNPSEATYRHGSVIVGGDEYNATFEDVQIGNQLFDIYVFDTIDNAVVKKGESFETLTTVTLDSWVTNEMVEQLGDQLEVYTWSEAIQAAGLDHASAMDALIGDDISLQAHATRLLNEVMGN